MIEFAYPWVFVLLALPLFLSKLPWFYRANRKALRISFKEDIDAITPNNASTNGVSRASVFQKIILAMVIVLVTIALAKPYYIGAPLSKEISQRELLVSIDLSGSMATKDFKDDNGSSIDRLEAVKLVLKNFFKEREGEKIGLILFGNDALVQAPFTQDLTALEHLLMELKIGMAGPQTAIGDSIGLGVKMFEDNNISDRLLILMSDGDDTGSKVPPLVAAKLAKEHHINIFTIAVGDPQNAGEHPMDTDMLQKIASETGGKSYDANDKKELVDIYAQIDKLKPKKVKVITHRPTFDLFFYPLLGALLLLFGTGALVFLGQKREYR